MDPRVNHVLSEIRHLVEQAAWGPEIPSRTNASDFQKGTAGVGEASNEADIQDAVDFYINNICQAIVDEFDCSEDEAYGYVEQAAEELADEGMLPELPSPEDGDEQAAMWLGAAKSMGFEGYCIKMSRDHMASARPSYRTGHDSDFSDTDNMGDEDMDSME